MSAAVVFGARIAHSSLQGNIHLDEAGLDALMHVDPGRLRDVDPLPGRIVLLAPGQPVIVLDDDAEELVGAACFQAPVELAAGHAHAWFVNNAPAEVHMTPTGGLIRVTGTVLEPFEAPAAELLPALVACGIRALALLHRIAGNDDRWQARLHDLDTWARDAAAAVRRI